MVSASQADGDANGDEKVDGFDFLAIQQRIGRPGDENPINSTTWLRTPRPETVKPIYNSWWHNATVPDVGQIPGALTATPKPGSAVIVLVLLALGECVRWRK